MKIALLANENRILLYPSDKSGLITVENDEFAEFLAAAKDGQFDEFIVENSS